MANQQSTLINRADFGKYRFRDMPKEATLKKVFLPVYRGAHITDLDGKDVGVMVGWEGKDPRNISEVIVDKTKAEKRKRYEI